MKSKKNDCSVDQNCFGCSICTRLLVLWLIYPSFDSSISCILNLPELLTLGIDIFNKLLKIKIHKKKKKQKKKTQTSITLNIELHQIIHIEKKQKKYFFLLLEDFLICRHVTRWTKMRFSLFNPTSVKGKKIVFLCLLQQETIVYTLLFWMLNSKNKQPLKCTYIKVHTNYKTRKCSNILHVHICCSNFQWILLRLVVVVMVYFLETENQR